MGVPWSFRSHASHFPQKVHEDGIEGSESLHLRHTFFDHSPCSGAGLHRLSVSRFAPLDQFGKFFVKRFQPGTALRKLTACAETENKNGTCQESIGFRGIKKVKFRRDAGLLDPVAAVRNS